MIETPTTTDPFDMDDPETRDIVLWLRNEATEHYRRTHPPVVTLDLRVASAGEQLEMF